jgi:hypothetical protein
MKKILSFIVSAVVMLIQPALAQSNSSNETWVLTQTKPFCMIQSSSGPIQFANDGSGLRMLIVDWRKGDQIPTLFFDDKEMDTVQAKLISVSDGEGAFPNTHFAMYSFDQHSLLVLIFGIVDANHIIVSMGDRNIVESLQGASDAMTALGNCAADVNVPP